MQKLLIPTKLTVCQLADGHRVRIIEVNETNQLVRVKSLRTGLPFRVKLSELSTLQRPQA